MRTPLLCLVLLYVSRVLGSTVTNNLKEEGRVIAKRFAERNYDFHGHDIAFVLHEKQPETFHRIKRRDLRSVADEGNVRRIRLDLNSGDNLHLTLKKRSVVNSETEFYSHTEHGLVKREAPATDCYATGYEGDSQDNIASVSLCDGLHGTVTAAGIEYYIHPVEMDNEDHQVHILWRRAAANEGRGHSAGSMYSDSVTEHLRNKRAAEEFDAWKTATAFEIEMAMFTDAHFWAFLHERVPGREDEFMLVGMNAVQVLYGDKEKVGYDVTITVKVMVNWEVDPEGYVFAEDLSLNLDQFCELTSEQYNKYDMLFLHTGVTDNPGPADGLAYMSGVCTKRRCACSSHLNVAPQGLIAHEIGHNLGFAHHDASKCPDDIKSQAGSFMGGGAGLNFSPCNKWELQRLFESGKGACLFEETGKRRVPKKYIGLPRVLAGQFSSPDDMCKLYAGDDYTYFRPNELTGVGECMLFLCINSAKKSSANQHIFKMGIPQGFPCGNEMFCRSASTCEPWDQSSIGWDVDYLRTIKQTPVWSNWSKKWGKCSRQCGTGVQTKERRCLIPDGPFLAPYCSGPSIQARLCKTKPCSGDPETLDEIRQERGNEMCQKFHDNDVPLKVDDGSTYTPVFETFSGFKAAYQYIQSQSCILYCKRNPESYHVIDGILPSGTPCLETTRSEYNLERFNIQMRCVQGRCMEFSDCRQNEAKDACGVCGGDTVRCRSKSFAEHISEGQRATVASIPAGSTGIDVESVKGATLELWSADGEQIIGKDGLYPKGKYLDDKEVDYAGTSWSYNAKLFMRTDGPTAVDLVVKLVGGDRPGMKVNCNYLLPAID